MSLPLKVLWTEGLTLGPLHFQQQDRYHEARTRRMATMLQPYLWGIRDAQWNDESLRNGTLQAEALSLVFPDGECYDAPGADPLPPPLDLDRLAPDEQTFTICALLPALHAHGGNVQAAGTAPVRYARHERETLDLYAGAPSEHIAYLHKVVRLAPQAEAVDGAIGFPVIRIRRQATGGFEVDPSFIPPAVTLAATRLHRMLEGLVDKLQAKVDALHERHRQPAKDVVSFHSGDITSYLMLNAISTSGAALVHCARHGQHHPETLFERMTTLAGGLMSFSTRYALADLPHYRHADAGPGFAKLAAIIRDLADTVLSSRYFTIPLPPDPDRPGRYRTRIDPAQVDRNAALCVAVSADMPALELVAAVPLRFKCGAPDDVERMVGMALPGIPLTHMAQVPHDVPIRPNTYYFTFDHRNDLYDAMLKAQALALYAPDGMKALKVELFALKGQAGELG
ncbi:type VI secretion system baseplate subunit TssK [Pseudoduganella ginsengisoli]|uniref:Type VI secretion system baseplate subunit TssK n=1 Tax=Pseudoduganella ginsengisoli TaxID=1462440 RepID=A0A6L6PUV8_9BURK|nr:type VI secretion system baseplate subunit TssK [Pseudoduganella ginsengisoli]MTW00996.1 type VI secretion system baseplate subunit TssK [Pseudoduganella ginsengisoli]